MLKYSEKEVNEIINKIDRDHNANIDYSGKYISLGLI